MSLITPNHGKVNRCVVSLDKCDTLLINEDLAVWSKMAIDKANDLNGCASIESKRYGVAITVTPNTVVYHLPKGYTNMDRAVDVITKR